MSASLRKASTAAAWLLAAILVMILVAGDSVVAGSIPANKAVAAGSKTIVAAPGLDVVLLEKKIKTSGPQDLIFQVTAECSIVTDVETVGDDDQKAMGHIEVWVTINGAPVLTAPGDADSGHVVFCDRAYRRQTLGFTDDDEDGEETETIRTFFSTRSTHAFNWVAFDLGSGIQTIAVHAKLEAATECQPAGACTVQDKTHAEAVLGNRTVVVEPARFANDADLVSG